MGIELSIIAYLFIGSPIVYGWRGLNWLIACNGVFEVTIAFINHERGSANLANSYQMLAPMSDKCCIMFSAELFRESIQ